MIDLLQARRTDPLISALVSAPVVTFAVRGAELETELFDVEERALGDAVPARRREFVTGRACAREALEALGWAPGAIGAGPSGEPLWPEGVVGAITHCEGLRACAVAPATEVRAIGIDAEPNVPLPAGILNAVSSAAERAALRRLDGVVSPDRLLFSAKEAAFKAWFSMSGRMLGFEDVRLDVRAGDGTFRVTPSAAEADPFVLHGRWAADRSHLACAVVVER